MTELHANRGLGPLGVIRHYWRVTGARPWHLLLPMGLAFAASAFEGGSLALIIPLKNAITSNSFDFLQGSKSFGWILRLVPSAISDSPARDGFIVALVIGLLVVGRVCRLAFDYFADRYSAERDERYRVLVGQETFGRVVRFGRKYFDRQALGKIDTEIRWSGSVLALLVALEGIFRRALGLLAKVVVMFAISLPLAIAFLVTVPLVQRVVAAINRKVRRIGREGVEVDRRIRSQMLDVLGSMPLVKAFSQEDAAVDAYTGLLRQAEAVAVRRDRTIGKRYPIEEITILTAMLLVQAGLVIATGNFSPAELATFGAFLFVLQQGLRDYKLLSRFVVTVFEELPRLEAVASLFDDEDKFIVPSGSRTFGALEDGIEVRGLRFHYQDGAPVLNGIDARIPAGRFTAIVGASGSGKSTLVGLIARLYDCPAGQILLDGVDVREFSLPSLHDRMTLVSQEVWMLNRTLRENLTFGLDREASDDELADAMGQLGLGPFLAELDDGLDTVVGDRGVRLSGGQRQRIALARALLRKPEILILDEATSALDSEGERQVARALRDRLAGHTLIVIAHRLSTIRDADQILVIQNGTIVERGTWDELVGRGGVFTALQRAQYREHSADEEGADIS